jgi:hypothetical protein
LRQPIIEQLEALNIFLSNRQSCALMTASLLLGMTLKELKKEIEDGAIVAVFDSGRAADRAGGADRGGDAEVGSGDDRRSAWR